jgi:hypothetical protein
MAVIFCHVPNYDALALRSFLMKSFAKGTFLGKATWREAKTNKTAEQYFKKNDQADRCDRKKFPRFSQDLRRILSGSCWGL